MTTRTPETVTREDALRHFGAIRMLGQTTETDPATYFKGQFDRMQAALQKHSEDGTVPEDIQRAVDNGAMPDRNEGFAWYLQVLSYQKAYLARITEV